MAVFTELTQQEVLAVLDQYSLADLEDLRGIASGIENSNFFLTTSAGRFVLTVFERLTAAQLPYYLGLMRHLARKHLPVPEPLETRTGQLFCEVRNKPAAIVQRLPGRAVEQPNPQQCAQVGRCLAELHLAAADYAGYQANLRGLGWCKDTAAALAPYLDAPRSSMLAEEVRFQDRVTHEADFERLPTGPIHADLFRDNVLFDGSSIGGVIDFYFAGSGVWLFDLAVTLNDWCVDLQSGAFALAQAQALLQAYHALRPLSELERHYWRPMLRAAALRFWLSRLYDMHLPRPAAVLQPHDPGRFERMLWRRIRDAGLPWVDAGVA